MHQIYVRFRAGRQVTIPVVIAKAIDVAEGERFLMSTLPDRRVLPQPVAPPAPRLAGFHLHGYFDLPPEGR